MNGPLTCKLMVIAADYDPQSPASRTFKEAMTEVGISVDRVVFGWTETVEEEVESRGAQFIVLAGQAALELVRPDLHVGECHGRAMLLDHETPDGPLVYPLFHPDSYYRNPLWRNSLLQELRQLIAIGRDRDNWTKYTPDTCVKCRGEFFRVDEQGVVYCELHSVPEQERPLTAEQIAADFGVTGPLDTLSS